jgi:hypothetical protein
MVQTSRPQFNSMADEKDWKEGKCSMPTRSEHRERLKKRRKMLFVTVAGCFHLTGFILAQTA